MPIAVITGNEQIRDTCGGLRSLIRRAGVGGGSSVARCTSTCSLPTNCMDPGYSSATDSAGKTNRWNVREKYTSLDGVRHRFGKTNGAGRGQPDAIARRTSTCILPTNCMDPGYSSVTDSA